MVLQQLLGLPTPDYAHLPVAVDSRGDKLSKQTGAPPLDERNPGPMLSAALRFLGQLPPPELAREPAPVIIAWAVAHWDLAAVAPDSAENFRMID
jgi:glutamyl-Q tRNA(Asp) synthetase